MGREGRAQGRPCPALAAPHGQGRRLRRVLHLQEHGAGAELSRQRPQIRHQGSKLPDPRPPTQPLHALLLLPPRRNLGPDGDAGGLVLPVPDHLLPQRPQLYRAGAQAGADRLPQDRQCLPRRRRRGGAAGRRRPAEPSHHPRPARLLDLDPGPEVLHQGAQAAQSLTLLCDRPDRVLPQLHLQAQLSHPQTVRAQLRARLMAPDKITEIFGTRLNRRIRGKLATVIDRIEHGHHVFRAYFNNAFLKQYEKFATFLRNELVSNNLADFRLKKGLDHLDAVRQRFQTITDRFAGFQAQWLNVHVDFPLLQRLALPITIGAVRYPGIKIHDSRVIRLLEVLLHGGSHVGGWTAKQIHHAVLTTFDLSDTAYRLNQLRYDLRKLKGHGLLQRDGSRYAYRLTPKGVQVALLFLFFHKRLCGPLANSRFHHRPDPQHHPASKLEAAYHRADKAIQQIVDLLAA